MEIENTFSSDTTGGDTVSIGMDISEDLKAAALAIEQVLSVAHERGSIDAVIILSTVSGLLRDVARYRRQSATG